jgi:hypothetical protein
MKSSGSEPTVQLIGSFGCLLPTDAHIACIAAIEPAMMISQPNAWLLRRQPEAANHQHGQQDTECRGSSARQMRVLEYVFEIDGDGDQQQSQQCGRGSDSGNEEVLPIGGRVRGHGRRRMPPGLCYCEAT